MTAQIEDIFRHMPFEEKKDYCIQELCERLADFVNMEEIYHQPSRETARGREALARALQVLQTEKAIRMSRLIL
jgi:hypothetical protein